jgi:hypothetical protein
MPIRTERVHLLVQLHRADLGGEGAARAARDDDRGEEHAELTQHRDGDEVHDEDLAAELAELLRADVGDDHGDQERNQRDDRHGSEARLVDVAHDRHQTQALRAHERAAVADRHGAYEAEEVERPLLCPDRRVPELAESARDPVMRRGFRLFGPAAASVRSMKSRGLGRSGCHSTRAPAARSRASNARRSQAPVRSSVSMRLASRTSLPPASRAAVASRGSSTAASATVHWPSSRSLCPPPSVVSSSSSPLLETPRDASR